MSNTEKINKAFEAAKEQYAEIGVDVEAAMDKLDTFPISLHCWQADDVGGFEPSGGELSGGGIMATVRATREASADELYASALPRIEALLAEDGKQGDGND